MARFDVAIVGGGPAGCRAAFRLARAGARVALVDGSHPREKPCGGGVTGRALALVREAIDLDGLGAVAIGHARFEHRGTRASVSIGRERETALPRLAVVARRRFDEALLSAARQAGAEVVVSRALDVARQEGGWRIATRDHVISADWLLGADGPGSLVRRRVHHPFDRAQLSIASGAFVYGATGQEIAIRLEQDPAGYLWSFPRADHLAVGVCGQADATRPAALHAVADCWIAGNVAEPGIRLERYNWPIPSLSVPALDGEPPSGRGWLLLGDAAGLVDPITREGIYFALASGDAAADSLTETQRTSERYAEHVRDTIHSELRRAARLKDWFFRPAVSALLVAALGRSARIRDVMADLVAGTQPYRGLRRRLIGTLEWKLMLKAMASATD